jgi:REP element-mobilizing transposase RayT
VGEAAHATSEERLLAGATMSIFYDPYAHTEKHRGNLPHWMQEGKMYFVTFRLADSIPRERLGQLEAEREAWRRNNPVMTTPAQWVQYYRLFCDRVEGWLDDNVGECLLARPDCTSVVAEALGHFDGKQYRLDHWVIMPNHVHVLFVEYPDHPLGETLQRWKSFTARHINKLCSRTGTLWQRESFDHIVRSEAQLAKYRDYIIENASKAYGKAVLSTQKVLPQT